MPEIPAPGVGELRERHEALLARLRAIAAANGHDPNRLRIVAVTKTWPIEVARTAVDAGIERFGENRIQEAEPKIAALPDVEWHLVGRLQSNKARRAVRTFAVIHSVDSFELLERLRRIGVEEARRLRLLIQVNVSGDPAKAGMTPETLMDGVRKAQIGDAGVVGLMTMAPMGMGHDAARAVFAKVRHLRDRVQEAAGVVLPELSMGMSPDADAAAAEGATLVRIGTALFGTRR